MIQDCGREQRGACPPGPVPLQGPCRQSQREWGQSTAAALLVYTGEPRRRSEHRRTLPKALSSHQPAGLIAFPYDPKDRGWGCPTWSPHRDQALHARVGEKVLPSCAQAGKELSGAPAVPVPAPPGQLQGLECRMSACSW